MEKQAFSKLSLKEERDEINHFISSIALIQRGDTSSLQKDFKKEMAQQTQYLKEIHAKMQVLAKSMEPIEKKSKEIFEIIQKKQATQSDVNEFKKLSDDLQKIPSNIKQLKNTFNNTKNFLTDEVPLISSKAKQDLSRDLSILDGKKLECLWPSNKESANSEKFWLSAEDLRKAFAQLLEYENIIVRVSFDISKNKIANNLAYIPILGSYFNYKIHPMLPMFIKRKKKLYYYDLNSRYGAVCVESIDELLKTIENATLFWTLQAKSKYDVAAYAFEKPVNWKDFTIKLEK